MRLKDYIPCNTVWILTYRLWEDIKGVKLENKVSEKYKMTEFSRIGSCHLLQFSLYYDCKHIKNNRFQIGKNQNKLKPC